MLNIFDWLRRRSELGRTATEIYGSIVAQARDPVFYTGFGVADVAEKRYEMIVVHVVLVLERLRNLPGDKAIELRRALTEEFVRDLDGSMREMAVGDTKVPAKVRKAAGGLLDRDLLYRDAFAGSANHSGNGAQGKDAMTVDALISELLFDGDMRSGAIFSNYVLAAREALSDWSPEQVVSELPFPDAAGFAEQQA